jgi:hypothetical protein
MLHFSFTVWSTLIVRAAGEGAPTIAIWRQRMDKKLGQNELIIVVAGAVALLGSFLPWIDVSGFSESAWGDFFPLLTWVGLFGAVMAAQILLRVFASVSMPDRVLGFSWPDLHLILAFFTALIAVSWLIVGEDFGIGFWLSLGASVALMVGAFRLRREISPVR